MRLRMMIALISLSSLGDAELLDRREQHNRRR
jgi:hypothetical protein